MNISAAPPSGKYDLSSDLEDHFIDDFITLRREKDDPTLQSLEYLRKRLLKHDKAINKENVAYETPS